MYIRILAMMHYVYIGEAVVSSKKCHFLACHREAYSTLMTVLMHPTLCW